MKNRIVYLVIACLSVMPQLLQAQNVGIGTTTPTAPLDINGAVRIRGGAPATGKVLTADANGLASWSAMGIVQPNTLTLSENPSDATLLANGYTNFAGMLVNTQTTATGTAPAQAWIPATHFLDNRKQPSVLEGSDNKFIVFGGYDGSGSKSSGAIYDPVADSWKAIPDMGDGVERSLPTVVWANGKLIVWGGNSFLGPGIFSYPNTGKIYDPATGNWTDMSTVNAPAGRIAAAAGYNAATNEFFIWGGSADGGVYFGNGSKYNLNTSTWTAMSTAGVPSARASMGFGLNNGSLFLFGGQTGSGTYTATSYLYNCASDTWTPTTASALAARRNVAVAYTGSGYVVWGGLAASSFNDGAVFSNNTWTPMTNSGAPPATTLNQTAYSNGYFVTVDPSYSYKYNVGTNTWSTMYTSERALHGLAGNAICLFIWGGARSLTIGDPVIEDGERFFWNTQPVTNHTSNPMQLYLYKKN